MIEPDDKPSSRSAWSRSWDVAGVFRLRDGGEGEREGERAEGETSPGSSAPFCAVFKE